MSVLAASRTGVLLLLSLMLGACASLSESHFSRPSTLQRFELEARLSVRIARPDEVPQHASGQMVWRHDGAVGREHLQILSPFGQTLADLRKQPGQVDLKLANGRQFQAENLQTLARNGLGYDLPFDDLPAWLEGRGSPQVSIERDASGRPSRLTDAPWTVQYSYPDTPADALPNRLDIHSTEGLEMTLKVDQWLTGSDFPAEDTLP